jgi:hypothetical protein
MVYRDSHPTFADTDGVIASSYGPFDRLRRYVFVMLGDVNTQDLQTEVTNQVDLTNCGFDNFPIFGFLLGFLWNGHKVIFVFFLAGGFDNFPSGLYVSSLALATKPARGHDERDVRARA